jgi:hypothetical protein
MIKPSYAEVLNKVREAKNKQKGKILRDCQNTQMSRYSECRALREIGLSIRGRKFHISDKDLVSLTHDILTVI